MKENNYTEGLENIGEGIPQSEYNSDKEINSKLKEKEFDNMYSNLGKIISFNIKL